MRHVVSFTYTLQLIVRFVQQVFKQLFCSESQSLFFVVGIVVVKFDSAAIST